MKGTSPEKFTRNFLEQKLELDLDHLDSILFCAAVAVAEVLIGIFRKWQIHFKDIDKFTKLSSLTVPVQIILGIVSVFQGVFVLTQDQKSTRMRQ